MIVKATSGSEIAGLLGRARRFLEKPWREKADSLRFRWHSFVDAIPVPVRLPFGAWWLARNDHVGRILREGQFESAEFAFVSRFVRPGMTVLDIGAHHGFYTLLLSKRVGLDGRVFAFEPSPRERGALLRHVRINRCRNVSVDGLALGSEEGEASLFVVQGEQTGCNSLRSPARDVTGELNPTPVHIVRLDDWLARRKIERVDFVKLDVEGGELGVLKGAKKLLERGPHPVILVEVQDIRTAPWGYPAKEILNYLSGWGYKWYRLLGDGSLTDLDITSEAFDGNFVACPSESTAALKNLLCPSQ
jgi:FkbM family methyltransferase